MAPNVNRFPDLAAVRARHAALLAPNWRRRAGAVLVPAGLAALLLFSLAHLDFSPERIVSGLGRLGMIPRLMLPPNPGTWERFGLFAYALGETLAISLLGTLLAAVLAFPLSLAAARNVMASGILRFLTRRSLDTLRGIDTLVWALIWIKVVGLGPFAGVLAIMCSDLGGFGKLFSEAMEATDRKASEGVMSTGGSHLQAVRLGLIPQVLPVIASQMLYFFESNIRSATVIGIVGAGGIGSYMSELIKTDEWQQVAFLILMLLVIVAMVDVISTRLRFAIIGDKPVV
ncbi:phosphonate ABC transporter, permease protein PhnE [Methylovirgula sp. 4M-Z18]|uniref:phosphonate ABC transporter, permease protein PhnE n=1 Tax=Methylovirgula sp. 4M-Z18 TaxID=2293567 RepID=UPI000E2F7919|nr:phosphonate ABC transporter, permease protein PhnE [Methylovirgula sp. 4M-Z18]RFB81600.1 phosphonate ABC transporter, permease protein PhnE [Methylovirgula sp. 4M-Z18]